MWAAAGDFENAARDVAMSLMYKTIAVCGSEERDLAQIAENRQHFRGFFPAPCAVYRNWRIWNIVPYPRLVGRRWLEGRLRKGEK